MALTLTGVLVNVTPARVEAGVDGGVAEATIDLAEHGSVQVVVDPARVGRNEIHLYTYDETDRPADLGDEVSLDLSLPSAGLGPITSEPLRAGPAHFTLSGDELRRPASGRSRSSIRIDRFTAATGSTVIEVSG